MARHVQTTVNVINIKSFEWNKTILSNDLTTMHVIKKCLNLLHLLLWLGLGEDAKQILHTQHENQKQMLIDASPRCEENQMHLIRICRRTEVKTPKDSSFFLIYTKKQIPTIFLISYIYFWICIYEVVQHCSESIVNFWN